MTLATSDDLNVAALNFPLGSTRLDVIRYSLPSQHLTTIPSLLSKAFGGAIAPTRTLGLPRRYFATMAAETTLEVQRETNGVLRDNGVAQPNGKRRKLHGRAFYESIGSPKLILAPMVEQSEFVCFLRAFALLIEEQSIDEHDACRLGDYSHALSSHHRSSPIC